MSKKYRFRLLAGTHKEDGVSYDARFDKKPVVRSDKELDKMFRNKFMRLSSEVPEMEEIPVEVDEDLQELDLQEEDDETIAEREEERKELLPGADTNLDLENEVAEEETPKPKKKPAKAKRKPAARKKATKKKTTKKKGAKKIKPVERGEGLFDVVLFEGTKETATMYNSDFLDEDEAKALAKKMNKKLDK